MASQTLFILDKRAVPIRDFLTYAMRNQRSQKQSPGQRLTPAQYAEQLYNAFVENAILEAVEQEIVARDPTFNFLLREYYEGILLFEIMEKEVWSKASADSLGQRRYYDSHRSRYQAPERAKAVIYSATAQNGFPALREAISAGDERKAQDLAIAQKIRIESGVFNRDEKEVLGKIPWSTGVYTTENSGMYYLAWLKEVLAPGVMSFEEARPSVISDFQSATEQRWLEQLRKKYPVKVNEKGKKYVIAKLTSETQESQ